MIQYKFPLELNYIQNIRFVLSLAEIGITMVVDDKWKGVFRYLEKQFMINTNVNSSSKNEHVVNAIDCCAFDHQRPFIKIFQIEKPLILPKIMLEKCRAGWTNEPSYYLSFRGLLTSERKQSLNPILKNISKISLDSINVKVQRMFLKNIKHYDAESSILIEENKKGRTFPVKAWDSDYFGVMQNSKFVLCPNGDFVWTYRFFEAIMCGSIPIVEETCEIYNGFTFFTFSDLENRKIEFSPEIREKNYKFLFNKFSFSTEETEYIVKMFELLNEKS